MACVLKPRIKPQFNRPSNLKGVAAFKQTNWTIPMQMSIQKSQVINLHCNRLSNSNVKVLTICLRLCCLWQQHGEHQLTASLGYFDDQVLLKRRLLPTIADSGALFFFMRVDITYGVNVKQFISWSAFL